MEWKEVTLSELGTIVGGATPSTKITSFYDGNIPWLTPKDLSVKDNKYIFRGERNITEEGFKSCSCKMLPKGSILFSSRAPIGYVAIAANDMCTNQGFKSVIPNDETDSEFLYYLLKYNKNNIASQGSGTTFAEVSGKTMKEIEVVVPKEKDDQRRIASILSSLDRKIELNNKINADLEEMAQAIFKNWFVDFEPFKDGKFVDSELGMIPEGWKIGTLTDVIKLMPGGTPKTSEPLYWDNGTIPFFSPKDVNGVYCFTTEKHITETGLNKCSSNLYPKDTIFITCRGTVGKVCLTACDMAMNQSNYAIKAIDGYSQCYVFFLVKSVVERLIKKSNGAVFSAITSKDFDEEILIPSQKAVEDFTNVIDGFFRRIFTIGTENSRLSLLRDTLLPRLMSGELEVPE
jgi:type I restriction enzyme S subunit